MSRVAAATQENLRVYHVCAVWTRLDAKRSVQLTMRRAQGDRPQGRARSAVDRPLRPGRWQAEDGAEDGAGTAGRTRRMLPTLRLGHSLGKSL